MTFNFLTLMSVSFSFLPLTSTHSRGRYTVKMGGNGLLRAYPYGARLLRGSFFLFNSDKCCVCRRKTIKKGVKFEGKIVKLVSYC